MNKLLGTPEVSTARSKLDGVLQTLVEKKDESPLKEEYVEEPMEEILMTPTKRSKHAKGGHKRKRHDEPEHQEMGQYHHTYVMKLFDRSVDLAQFDESTPLYPVCRAWMKNQPHNRNLGVRGRSPTPPPDMDSSDEDEDFGPVYKLPSPVPIKTERGYENVDLRVPSPLPVPEGELNLEQSLSELHQFQPLPEHLLLNHMARWKQVRQTWKDASRANEARYAPSLNILKEMYDRVNKDQ